jgi:hypothetical protein
MIKIENLKKLKLFIFILIHLICQSLVFFFQILILLKIKKIKL